MGAPVELVAHWEAAYGNYTHAYQWADRATQDPDAAQAMAATSWKVAELWRALAGTPGLQWWTVAALQVAAEVFNAQANTWHDRAQQPPPRTTLHVLGPNR